MSPIFSYMANLSSITGVAQVLKNLEAKRIAYGLGTARGLKKAGLTLQRASQLKVPVDLGVLKNSAFTRAFGSGIKTVVTVGYTANYAIYVHENVEMKGRGMPRSSGKGNYWDPAGRGQAKFLEEPARSMKAELRNIILTEARKA